MIYDADRTQASDPQGKKTDQFRDALGRLESVTEDPGGLGYGTQYAYDPLGNLLAVTKGTQTRSFAYTSLSQLLAAVNPENGTLAYAYWDDGSLKTKTDARNITATYTYDNLGRIQTVDYSNTTPDVTYTYYGQTDAAPKIGRLKSIGTSVATESFLAYDTLGRVTSHSQTIAGNPNVYTLNYTYGLDDSLKTIQYPSGRTLTTTFDDAGRPRTVSDGATTYANLNSPATPYDPLGRIAQIELGNELWETRKYRPAGTVTELQLGTSAGATDRLELEYNYPATTNNGNLASHVIRHRSLTRTQSFGYDNVNRLTSASESGGFSRTFAYDRWGNRWVASNTGMTYSDTHEPTSSTNFNTSTNRLNVAGATYDAAGNQTYYAPYTLTFDAENRITSASSASLGSMVYAYDGTRRRVGNAWTPNGGSETITYYIYDIAGRIAAEYTDAAPDSADTAYIFTDLLGSVRAVTGEKPPSGTAPVTECYDYLPFGRFLSASDNGRSAVSCYQPTPESVLTSDLSEKFTGQQKDEIKLDYFVARYFSGAQGRFTGADIPFMDQHVGDPQSWNLYAYVRNNSLRFVDPTGQQCRNYDDGGLISSVCDVWEPIEELAPYFDRSVLELSLFVLESSARQAANLAAEVAFTVGDLAVRYPAAPRNPGCMALATGIGIAAGTDVGATLGAGGGLVVGGGVASFATTPAGALGGAALGAPVGGAAGAGAGWLLCAQMSGGGGSGSGSGSRLSREARRELGNLADRAGETVRDVIRSRGGRAANVNRAGHWADKTLSETAQAAANGDPIVKQARRLGGR